MFPSCELTKEVQAIIQNKSLYVSKKSCNPRNADSGSNPNYAQEKKQQQQRKAGFIKAKATKYNSFMQMKDCWLGDQGLVNSNVQTREAKLQGGDTGCMGHAAAVPGCLPLSPELTLATG